MDLNSLWSMDAEYLAHMADALGLRDDARQLRAEQAQVNRLMNQILWNEDLGVYCHRFWNKDGSPGAFETRLTPMNFYPLICGAPDERRAKRMLGVLTDPNKFWGRWIIPTLAYDDPDWHDQGYWKGNAWSPVNYLKYGSGSSATGLRNKRAVWLIAASKCSCKIGRARESVAKISKKHGRNLQWLPARYTWGALLSLIGLEAFIDIGPEGRPVAQGSKIDGTQKIFSCEISPREADFHRLAADTGKLELER